MINRQKKTSLIAQYEVYDVDRRLCLSASDLCTLDLLRVKIKRQFGNSVDIFFQFMEKILILTRLFKR